MKVTIERSALLGALSHVQSIVERRNTIPILSNVQIVSEDDALHLSATDLDIAVMETVPCVVEQSGGTTAPAHTLYDIVRKLPDGSQVELEQAAEEGRLTVRAARSKFALSCLPQEDFPAIAEDDLPHRFEMPAADLRKLIDKSRFAISTEETRYYLNGIYLHAPEDAKVLRGVATDGHRLARVDVPLPQGGEQIPGVIVPRKTVLEVYKLIEGLEGPVEIGLSETRIRFSFDAIVLTSKLIDGTFPDYQRVIPSGNDKIMRVDRRVFAEAVDRVATISSEKSRAIKMSVGGDTMMLTANSPDQGTGSDEVAVEFESSDQLEVGFNARYLIDIAQQIDGDNARFDLADGASPTIIRDADDEAALYVLMPMRV
jgi:DNA polymerase-3 subunit beta